MSENTVRVVVSRAGYCVSCGASSYFAAQVMLHQIDRDPRPQQCMKCGSGSVIVIDTQDVLDMEDR